MSGYSDRDVERIARGVAAVDRAVDGYRQGPGTDAAAMVARLRAALTNPPTDKRKEAA